MSPSGASPKGDMDKKYDYVVIGSGPAGHVSAIRAAQLGLKVAVVEKNESMFGGVCLNEGCIPAKSLFNSAKIICYTNKSTEVCGLEGECKNYPDLNKIVAKSREAAETLKKGLSFLFKKNNIDLILGKGSFIDSTTLQITQGEKETGKLKADKFLIATGSRPRKIPGISFGGSVISSSKAICLEKLPEKVVIVGGGAIGVEFASFYSILGAEVVIVEMESHLLPKEDREIAKNLQSIFRRRGVTVHTASSVEEIIQEHGSTDVIIKTPDGELTEKCDTVLVCIGRIPLTSNIGLEKIGVETDKKGFIKVDPEMRTTVSNIYAAGDIIPTTMVAHAASAEGEIAAEIAAGKKPEPIDYSCMPMVTYSDVQVASVGLTEHAANEKGLHYKVGKQFFLANGMAVVTSRTEGLIKIIADKTTHKLLGVHIAGYQAAELIHEFNVAKRAGLTVEDIEKTVHAHPTFSEAAVDACKAVFGSPIHG